MAQAIYHKMLMFKALYDIVGFSDGVEQKYKVFQ